MGGVGSVREDLRYPSRRSVFSRDKVGILSTLQTRWLMGILPLLSKFIQNIIKVIFAFCWKISAKMEKAGAHCLS